MTNPRYYFTRVVGHRPCPKQPSRLGLKSMSYPWDEMQPGEYIVVFDPSDQARNRLAASASQAAKRLGVYLSTGKLWPGTPGLGDHIGWWCIRHDGCEIEEPPPSVDQIRGAEARARFAERRRKSAEGRFRRQRMQPLSALGDHAPDVAPVIPEAPAEEADAWLRPVVAGEVF